MRRIALALSVMTLATLVACGGGGGSDSGSTNTGGSTGGTTGGSTGTSDTVVLTGSTINTVTPATGYAPGTVGDAAMTSLNALRLAAGTGTVTHSAAMDAEATAHANYLQAVLANGSEFTQVGFHNELSTVEPTLYTGDIPQARIWKGLSVTQGFTTETIGGDHVFDANGHLVADGSTCPTNFLGTVYHADAILSQVTEVAIAEFQDSVGEQGCLIDFYDASAHGQVPASQSAVVNPAPGTTVSGSFSPDAESPRPAVGLIPNGATAGTPVLLNVRNVDWVNASANGKLTPVVNSFTLTAANGTVIDAVLLSHSLTGAGVTQDAQMLEGSVSLLPKQALAAGVYSVHADVTIASGKKVVKDWTFTAQ